MSERRQRPRSLVFYGGMVAFNDRSSTITCVVRNYSASGVKIEFANPAFVPDEIDFTVARKGLCCRARMVWRDRYSAGLLFSDPFESRVIPLEWARRLHASDRTNKELKARLEQLRSEH